MRGYVRMLALAGVGAILLLVISASTAVAAPDCSDRDGVVGTVADEEYEESVAVYAGSSVDVTHCENGDVDTRNWLGDEPGYSIEGDDGGIFTLTIDGTAEQVTIQSPDEEGDLEITVLGTGTEIGGTTIYGTNASLVDRYQTETATLEAALANLSLMIETYSESEEIEYEWAKANLTTIQTVTDEIDETETELNERLSVDVRASGVGGGTEAITALDDQGEERRAQVADITDAYDETVIQDRDGAASVYQPIGGSLVAGMVLGAIIGAAVPVRAARRVEQTRRLSSSVTYDRQVVLLPVLIGVAAIIAGVVTLVLFGGADLFEVML